MLPSSNCKSRSALSDSTANKKTLNAPNGKLPKAGSTKSNSSSPSSLKKSRTAVDQSRRLVESRSVVERHPQKTNIVSDKQRVLKTAVSLSQLDVVQGELTKAVEQLSLVEIERSRLSEELKDARKSADEANGKLLEALSAKKKAEEYCEIEKFRADEIEQASIEALQKKEDEGQKELENIRNRCSNDVAAFNSVSRELKAIKRELQEANDVRNTSMRHADDAMKSAEMNAEKVIVLSAEVNCLKDMLDSKEGTNNEVDELVKKLNSEIGALKRDLERAKAAENNKFVEMETLIGNLRMEAKDANSREFDAGIIVAEWKKKVELLEDELEESNEAHMAASNSLASAMREMEENNASLRDAQFKIGVLQDRVASFEGEVARKRADLEESDQCLDAVKLEALERGREAEALRDDLRAMEIEIAKMRAELKETDLCLDTMKNKVLAREGEVEALRSQLRTMEEEKMQATSKDINTVADIESFKEEKTRLVIELEASRDEAEKNKKAMEDLASALHEVSLEARETRENLLTRQVKADNADAEIKELKTALKNMEEKCEVMLDEAKYENVCLRKAVERMENEAEMLREEWDSKEYNFINAVKKSEDEIAGLVIEMTRLLDLLKEAQDASYEPKEEEKRLNDVLEQVRAEVLKLKRRFTTKENDEIHSINQMKDDVLSQDAFYVPHEDGERVKSSSPEEDQISGKENGNGYGIDEEPVEVELMDISSELDSIDDDQVSKIDSSTFEKINIASEGFENGSSSPSRQKKKKALLVKIGTYLRKKSNQK